MGEIFHLKEGNLHMKKEGYFTTGQFMKLTHVSKKTLRYYDEHNILKPSWHSDSGARYYSSADLAKMQQILLLKYLGFSLSDIREMTIQSEDTGFFQSSLKLQKKLVEDKIEQLQIISHAIDETAVSLKEHRNIDWSGMLELIHSMGMEQSLKTQYQNASNISARINLHSLYSQNEQHWFPWIFEQCMISTGQNILEIGCGDGSFWAENMEQVPDDIQIFLSDKSDGMLRDAAKRVGSEDSRFHFCTFDCIDIPYDSARFDRVIANHVLFYCSDIPAVCREVSRVLKPSGRFICSTYGANHMKEINRIVTEFDDRIVLSAEQLYFHFGRENGTEILHKYFSDVRWISYEDSLFITETAPLISYILSCHGNQTQFILDRYKEFHAHIEKYVKNGLRVTKDAGIFICQNA